MGRLRHIVLMCGLLGAGGLLMASAAAQETKRRVVVEDIPALQPVKHVSANKTHSGLPVPRYVSLKFGRINGRNGPSVRHPALWQYRRKGLPLIVVAEMDIWRKVRDMHGDESWVRTQALSGQHNGVALLDVSLHSRPKETARIKAIAEKGALLHILQCNAENWCQVSSKAGYKGWVLRNQMWGAEPLR